jgi:outer membrane receptor protein involved in Fe transport
MSLDIAHTKWQVALWARNLTNKYYYDGGDDFATTVGYSTLFVGRPRTYGGEVAYRF